MKIAILYNRESKNVINLFGQPNKETYGIHTIKRIRDALRKYGHQVTYFEADKSLIEKLESFMPSVVKGERPGMVFNLSYGVQGNARYTHVPGMLEMIGIPYVGSGPLAHSLCLDKVVAKMLFVQNDIPTPDFFVAKSADMSLSRVINYPVIVKPKNESTSFGIRICHDEVELREGIEVIIKEFNQDVLVEQYIEGREINVGILGNDPAQIFPPAEIIFGDEGPKIYSLEDKRKKSGREIKFSCPAELSEEITERAKELALKAFKILGCHDCARIDFRLDSEEDLYVLELNSLPSLGPNGSYTQAAEEVGLDYTALVNALIDVASLRYFGCPILKVTEDTINPNHQALQYLISRRHKMEKKLLDLGKQRIYGSDIHQVKAAFFELNKSLKSLKKIKRNNTWCNSHTEFWETDKGLDNGTLLLIGIDDIFPINTYGNSFQVESEWVFGDTIARTKAPMVMLEYMLKALSSIKQLGKVPLGLIIYADEGSSCQYSRQIIEAAAKRAKNILLLTPGLYPEKMITDCRGYAQYKLIVETAAKQYAHLPNKTDLFGISSSKLMDILKFSEGKNRFSVGIVDQKVEGHPLVTPTSVNTTIQVSYYSSKHIEEFEKSVEKILNTKPKPSYKFYQLNHWPPLVKSKLNDSLFDKLLKIAQDQDIKLEKESSSLPTVAGLITSEVAIVCGLAPVGKNIHTPNEAVKRISLIQRTIILTNFLLNSIGE